MSTPIYLRLLDGDGYDIIELPPSSKHLLLRIPYIQCMSETKTLDDMVYGSSPDCPIALTTVPLREFIEILKLLELQDATQNTPFTNPSLSFTALISTNWDDLDLPPSYLRAAETMSTECLVRCMCTCSELNLYDVRQLLMYRMIHLLYKSCEVGPTMEILVKCSQHYDITVFQKGCRNMILTERRIDNSREAEHTNAHARARSQSI